MNINEVYKTPEKECGIYVYCKRIPYLVYSLLTLSVLNFLCHVEFLYIACVML
jgi:hypothetical protein